jgi:hypothetical protein
LYWFSQKACLPTLVNKSLEPLVSLSMHTQISLLVSFLNQLDCTSSLESSAHPPASIDLPPSSSGQFLSLFSLVLGSYSFLDLTHLQSQFPHPPTF